MSTTAESVITPESVRIDPGTYGIDPVHSRVGFEVKHLGISTFRGSFSGFAGTIAVGEAGLEGIEGTIEVTSVEVPDKTLAGHLLGSDFFDAGNHPEGSFSSTEIIAEGEGSYRVAGDFTLRGVTRPIELTVGVEGAGPGMDGSPVLSLSAAGVINRNDFGISWGATVESGAAVVAEKVRLVLDIEAVKAGE
jgi:polyisoprenoid-binding protein YceI